MTIAYPVALHLEQRPVLIVGGGGVGARKAQGLLDAGALVTAVSRAFSPQWDALPAERLIAPYAPAHIQLHPFHLVFAATDSADVNARVQADAAARAIPCCRCDDATSSDFSGMATARVGGITLAVSTSSGSPLVAAQLRDHLASQIEPAWALLAERLPLWRQRVRAQSAGVARRDLLRRLASVEMLTAIRTAGLPAGERLLDHWLSSGGRDPADVQ